MYNTLYVCVYLQGIRGGGVFAGLPCAQRGSEGNNLMTFITAVTFGKCWIKAKSFLQYSRITLMGLFSLSHGICELQRHLRGSPETPGVALKYS